MNNPETYTAAESNNLDIGGFLMTLAQKWYLFAIFLGIFIPLGILSVQITSPTYKVKASMLIDTPAEEASNLGSNQFLEQGVQLFNNRKNLVNEITYLKSYELVKKPLEFLGFNIGYFVEDGLRDKELYKKSPFVIIPNDASRQVINTPFHVKFLSETTYEITVEADEYSIIHPDLAVSKVDDRPIELKKTCNIGEQCQTEDFSFLLLESDNAKISDYAGEELYFKIYDIRKIAEEYTAKLEIILSDAEGSVIELSSEGTVVSKEVDFLNQLCETYIQAKLDEKNMMAAKTIEFIDDQIAVVTDSLQGAEEKLSSIRRNQRTLDLNLTASNAVSKLQALEAERADLNVKNQYYTSLLNELDSADNLNAIVAPSAIGISDPILNELVLEMKRLSNEKIAKSIGSSNQSIEMRVINDQIQHNKNVLRENARNILKSTEYAINENEKRINQAQSIVSRLPKNERDLVKVQRIFDFNETLYNYLLQRRAEAGIAEAANSADSKILDTARQIGTKPISPNVPFIMAGCLILGLLLPILIIAVMEAFQTKITDPLKIEKRVNSPIVGNILQVNSMPRDILDFTSQRMASLLEDFRYLKVNLQYLAPEKDKKIVGITSTIPGEGKSFCSIQLANALALSSHKVVVLATDMRRPKLGAMMGVSNQVGLRSFLTDQAQLGDIIKKTKNPNMDIIPCGHIPPNPGELLAQKKFQILLDVLKNSYDYIILDTPPSGLVADYLIVSRHVDVNFYIVRMNHSRWEYLRDMKNLVQNGDLKNLYIILNGLKKGPGTNKYAYYSYYTNSDKNTNNSLNGSGNSKNGSVTVRNKIKTLIGTKS
ncbi:MAG: polysaccharide biosynthesis tyrosine autokinase [Bacteroidetes bacterium]|nr:polysaccharide biosynthesis tyrosine autokinase [Bacteroidota bacterium]